MEKILITGADGFFASRFLDFFSDRSLVNTNS